MIPRLIACASAPRLTKMCRPTATLERAITCQKRASVPPAFHTYPSKLHQVSKSCSCVGSSTLATGPSGCCKEESSKATSSRISQQTRDNSISVSAAATLLGGHGSDLTAHHYGPPDSSPGTTTSASPTIESFLDENSVLGTLKRINDGAGRKKGRSKKQHLKRSDATMSSVRDLLAQLAQQQQTNTATSASTTSPTTSATSKLNAAPTLEMARTMPQSCRQMDNTSLMCLAALDVVEARSEVLRRHIMDVDSVSYDDACATYSEIRDYNNATLSVAHTIPYNL